MADETVLQISGLNKSFGPVRALSDVRFELRKGEIHAVAGENGAGKSTLMNIIDGILQPDSGDIILDGRKVTISSPTEAQRYGIGFVHQEIALCPDVSVAENIFMARTNASRSFFMDYRKLEQDAAEVFRQLSGIDPSVVVRDLSISNQQLVEIAKALTLNCRILILDEPTAALTLTESQVLFDIMRKLADRGMSIIYISHRMVEIFENCDRVTVLRDGKYITTRDVAEISPSDVVNAMVGRVIDGLYPEKQTGPSEEIIFEARDLNDEPRFSDVSFQLRKGEVLGLAGLIGAGRSEIARGICRLEGKATGEIVLNGQKLDLKTYRDCVKHGIVYLSEDRKGDGVFLDMAIAANISALRVEQVANGLGLIRFNKEAHQAKTLGAKLNLKYGSLSGPVSLLSGGNQQKVALAKMLSVDPSLIFLDEPTRGVDVGAKSEIHRILRDLASTGVGIVVISSELPELIGLCDRVLVVREGRISGEVSGEMLTEREIMRLASIVDADDRLRARAR
ncbi:sugar ABC transporter ATP-binding protein [Silicimonas algicola]|uniref:Monosaccharide ABC transporter ATP-binding protein (CUT2 family) n=1 Tax=Silicimonas algicola TaxID=1826607 RepID=A0A316G475_9RHOB|nr:sugar ABC transporter ATP-binding protein [Silicimonas algicola]AZQ67082.1 sugar ABC transporter ATP-binding protein [Silicimonas algicola]PWK55392.1 monosaccharide ABC transporter ATP-binding protein (CUT2 family) [Silicimonas algicola]